MKLEKKYLYLAIVLLVVLLAGYWFFIVRSSNKQTANVKPTEAVIPTIDSSVQISLTADSAKKNVVLGINGIPSGTNTIDYELSYQTASQGLQGIIGTITISGQSSFQKNLTLGTCSSGKCVYHQVVGKINLSLKFSGDYGEKIFAKDFYANH